MKKTFLLSLLLIFLGSCNVNTNSESAISDTASDSTTQLPSDSSFADSSTEEDSSVSESITSTDSESVSESDSTSDTDSDTTSDSTSEPSSEDILADSWTNSDFGDYYKNIDVTSSTLLSDLRSLNSKKMTFTVGYKNMWNYFNKTDYDPADKTKVLAYYNNKSSTKADMNKEHVWPKSRGGNLIEGDIHVIRPTLTSDNSSRGNSFYVEGKNSTTDGWDPKAGGLVERYRGDAARIVFYGAIASSSLKLVDLENDNTSNNSMGKLSDLLKWNLQYPVVQTELNRNNGAEDIQGNRNPFIDNPGFACAIWGATNEKTKQICSGSYVPENPPIDIPSDSSGNDELPELDTTWALVNNISDLNDGDTIVIANNQNNTIAGPISTSSNPYLTSLEATFSADKLFITSMDPAALMFEVNKVSSGWTLSYNGKLLGATGTKKMSLGSGTTTWSISISSGVATISNTTGSIQYNTSHPRFTTYTSSIGLINIYKLIE